MRAGAPEERRKVYITIDAIVRGRKSGNMGAKHSEIVAESQLPETTVQTAIVWLKRNLMIVKDSNQKAWKVCSKRLKADDICWWHGEKLPCISCQKRGRQ